MNVLEKFTQYKTATNFNSADIKGIINVGDYSFDIRLVGGEIYANGLLLQDFMREAMISIDEEIAYEEAIYKWLSSLSSFLVA